MVLTKQDLIGCLQHEAHILVHLASKVTPEMLDYRPTPKQRSTIELLRYLTLMGPELIKSVKAGTFLVDDWTAAEKEASTLHFDSTLQRLQSLSGKYVDLISSFSDEDFGKEINLFGAPGKVGPTLVNLIISGHAAYRTQLFLYLKANGREELNTMNLWAGVDAPA